MPEDRAGSLTTEADAPFSTIEEAIAHIREGGIALLVDDEDRENEGDLVMAAEKVTPEAINFMTKEARGLVCLALTAGRVEALGLPMMVPRNRNGSAFGTNFTVSIEAREGVTTGISAFDRAHTIQTAIRESARPADLVTPGHIFPLRGQPGGVLRRAGHTEGAVDLARLAGLKPAGVICEVLREDGSMARLPDLAAVARRHNLPLVTIKDLIAYRMRHERLVERIEEGEVETPYGTFRAVVYLNRNSGNLHLALVLGEMKADVPTLVRVHPVEPIKDFVQLLRSDCSDRVRNALSLIQQEGRGAFVYLHPDMRGEEALRISGQAPSPAAGTAAPREAGGGAAGAGKPPTSHMLRDYGIGAQILADLGLRRLRIITNDARRIVALEGYGLQLEGRVPVVAEPHIPTRRTGTGEGAASKINRLQ